MVHWPILDHSGAISWLEIFKVGMDCFSFAKDSTKTEAKVELEFPRVHQRFAS
jgi:hypothetical protein